MPDQTLPAQKTELSGLFKSLALVGVLYYVLFAGLGLETDRELSRFVEQEAAASQVNIASN